MMSQRMAKFYQEASWGISDASGTTSLGKSRQDFADALQELSSAPANTQQIKDGLGLLSQQWFFFENALAGREVDKKVSQANVATTCERILETMDSVVGMYEKLAK
mgnify:CR=1 FL=1